MREHFLLLQKLRYELKYGVAYVPSSPENPSNQSSSHDIALIPSNSLNKTVSSQKKHKLKSRTNGVASRKRMKGRPPLNSLPNLQLFDSESNLQVQVECDSNGNS